MRWLFTWHPTDSRSPPAETQVPKPKVFSISITFDTVVDIVVSMIISIIISIITELYYDDDY